MVLRHKPENKKHNPELAQLLHALGGFTKKVIVETLAGNEVDIETLQQLIGMRYQTIYQHLQELEEIGFITSYKVGKDKYYVLNEDALEVLQRWLTVLTKQLSASHAHYQQPDEGYNFGNTQQIGSDGGEKHWYRESNI